MEELEDKGVKSKRDLLLDRMRAKYPDDNFDEDEVLMGKISDDLDQYDQELKGYQDREKSFSDMFTADPRSARLMSEWRKGGDPAVNLIRLYGAEIKDAIDDPEMQEQIAEANREYVERIAKEKNLEEQYQENLVATMSGIESLQNEEGVSDDEIDMAMEYLVQIMQDGIIGKFSVESIKMALKAIHHDDHVAEAAEEGELRGRNAKISKRIEMMKDGDGMPRMGGSPSMDLTPRKSNGAIDRMSERESIYERGQERRTSYKR